MGWAGSSHCLVVDMRRLHVEDTAEYARHNCYEHDRPTHLLTHSSSCIHKLPLLRVSNASYVELLVDLGYLICGEGGGGESIQAEDQVFYFSGSHSRHGSSSKGIFVS